MDEYDELAQDELSDTGDLSQSRPAPVEDTDGIDTDEDDAREDTGSFETLERITRVDTVAGEPMVYGLSINVVDDQKKRDRSLAIRWIAGGALAVLALLGFLVIAQPFSSGGKQEAAEQAATEETVDEDEATPEEEPESSTEVVIEEPPPKPEPVSLLSVTEIIDAASKLNFNGEDLSVDRNELEARIEGTRVMVVHIVDENSGLDPSLLAGRAAQRGAALARSFAETPAYNDGTKDLNVSDVTWVVRNKKGDAYLAVWFPTNDVPTDGSGLTVLSRSYSYRLSGSLFTALGSWPPQEVGDSPTTPDGKVIETLAGWPS